ncbi:hypothetical protein A3K86_04190 [Photobacterium jeanii]|uniref:diguanylate cyclase n=3 Tax=Photobacterium jeanii TaxID=858640 RepID=A0A178KLQ0_9GAMM|nr:hypothetical protein A3K86_04190 [Photobacterium jeanii]
MVNINTKNLSFRVQVTLSLLVLITAIPIGLMWYASSDQILQKSVEQMFRQSSRVITNHLDDFFDEAYTVYQHQDKSDQDFAQIVQDRDKLLAYLSSVLAHHQQIDYLYFANAEGGLLSLGRDKNGNFIRIETEHPKAGKTISYSADASGKGTQIINTNEHFDPRVRQWYRRAVTSNRPVWSDIYPGAIEKVLGVSLAKAQYDEQGNLLGVWGLDLTLNTLQHELAKNTLSKNSSIMLISEEGTIVASSTDQFPPLMELGTPLTPVANILWNKINLAPNGGEPRVSKFHVGRDPWIGAHTQYQIGQKRHLTILFISPMCDFIGEFIATKYFAVAFTLFLVSLAIFYGSKVTHYMLRPIAQLQRGVKLISGGKWSSRIKVNRQDELGLLASSFNDMADHLQATIQQLKLEQSETTRLNELLAKSNAELEQKVQERTAELKNANIQLQYLANIDPLTQVANRRFFWQQMEQRKYQSKGWLLILDIDNFKKINDTHGHLVGDDVLQHFCRVCTNCIGDQSLFGRIGGEEFAIFIEQHQVKDIRQFTKCLLTMVSKTPMALKHTNIHLTTSIGVTETTPEQTNAYALADNMLLQAKSEGKNRAIFYHGETITA